MVGLALLLAGSALADPCGMVPPAWIPDTEQAAIQRQGEQITYAFFKDGVETLVLRPGFTGSVDQFGMLIPFPSPPSLRKTADDTYAHIDAAVDAPEVTVYRHDPRRYKKSGVVTDSVKTKSEEKSKDLGLKFDEVRVVNQEAVGMYEVAVLQAGSSSALNSWMADHEFRYPEGMDAVIDDYVALEWAFVAIKAKVGQMPGVAPQPGMTGVDPKLPGGASFDGHVQGMGFRFETPEPVIPMRLAAFNEAQAHNTVYFLSDEPVRIDGMTVELIRRQVSGSELEDNLTSLLPVRVADGSTLNRNDLERIEQVRNPEPYNGIAAELFAADLYAAQSGELSLPFEEAEKDLLRVSESLGLRGADVDALHHDELDSMRDEALAGALYSLQDMTLTVFDGDFDPAYTASTNLAFARWEMDDDINSAISWTRRPAGPTAYVYR